jgi:hypothetical protein
MCRTAANRSFSGPKKHTTGLRRNLAHPRSSRSLGRRIRTPESSRQLASSYQSKSPPTKITQISAAALHRRRDHAAGNSPPLDRHAPVRPLESPCCPALRSRLSGGGGADAAERLSMRRNASPSALAAAPTTRPSRSSPLPHLRARISMRRP